MKLPWLVMLKKIIMITLIRCNVMILNHVVVIVFVVVCNCNDILLLHIVCFQMPYEYNRHRQNEQHGGQHFQN